MKQFLDSDGVLHDMPVVFNMLTARFRNPDHETSTKPSSTIPDQSLSMREILKRYARGIPMDNVTKAPIYRDESMDDMPDIAQMDYAEREEFRLQAEDELKTISNRQKERNESKKQKSKTLADNADDKGDKAKGDKADKSSQAPADGDQSS